MSEQPESISPASVATQALWRASRRMLPFTAGILKKYWLIGQLVRASALGGEVISQVPPHGPHRRTAGFTITPGGVLGFNLPAHRLPFRLRHTRGDAAVRHDFDAPIGEQQVDQNPVIGGGIPDPESREHLQGPRPRCQAMPERFQ